ncbi:MAG: KOW domain-containing RNA-binding protein [Oscillospiraceae bacterium]|nr:KOW domain-containing RNA-binding protein [Oscillospiraceae bacterium]
MDLVKGQLVRSKAGRDKTRTFAVLALDGQIALLANGTSRPIAKPKRKKLQHLAPTGCVLCGEALTDDQQLSEAIAAYDATRPV